MSQTLTILGSFLGGLGLFILAVRMMTDGLRHAAGDSLRNMLSGWTSTPFKGILTGFFMTAIVQSSSAVTVASIGFVNAGLLSMRHTLGIIYGANIGTTVTAWLVAVAGFSINIQALALPLIGAGMIIQMVKREGRMAELGLALVGFGLFFVGIDVLKNAFEGLVLAFDITRFNGLGAVEIILFVLVGIVMTVLTQSSSASIALTITAATTGMLGLYSAAAMVIGANVGTTSTAMMASIGATANAKRVAMAQLIFNFGTAVVALLILPLMFMLISNLSRVLGLTAEAGISLALFHSIFNILGVILIFPLNNRLATFLEKRFVSRDAQQARPKYLDKTIAATPVLAVNALVMELEAIANRVSQIARMAVYAKLLPKEAVHKELFIVRALSIEVSRFIVSLERNALSEETIKQLATLLRIDQYLTSCANTAEHIQNRRKRLAGINLKSVNEDLDAYHYVVTDMLSSLSTHMLDQSLVEIQRHHDTIKAKLLIQGADGRLSFEAMLELIDIVGEQMRMTQQWLKALKYLQSVQLETGSVTQYLDENGSSLVSDTASNDGAETAPASNELTP